MAAAKSAEARNKNTMRAIGYKYNSGIMIIILDLLTGFWLARGGRHRNTNRAVGHKYKSGQAQQLHGWANNLNIRGGMPPLVFPPSPKEIYLFLF